MTSAAPTGLTAPALGRRLADRVAAVGWTATQAAEALDLSLDQYAELLNGALEPSNALAARLAHELGDEPEDWLMLGARPRAQVVNSGWGSVATEFNGDALKALRDRGYVSVTRARPAVLAEQLAAFFGCGPEDAASGVRAAFRQSAAHPVDPEAVAVWLRLAERQARWLAETEDVPALDLAGLRKLMPHLVQVGRQDPAAYLLQVQQDLADVGVALVFQADVPGTRLSGACWSSADTYAVVALTLRGRRDDMFWWTMFHELGHVLLGHDRVVESEEATDPALERDADALAKSLLLPDGWSKSLRVHSAVAVQALADELRVPAGVLVGQLQHEGVLPRGHLNALRRSTPAADELEQPSFVSRRARR